MRGFMRLGLAWCAFAACSGVEVARSEPASNSEALHAASAPTLTPQDSGTTNSLIGLSVVNERVVWASGRAGTFAVTTNGGASWRTGVVAGAEALQFRDVEGVSERVAYLLSIGTGTDSRIYKTTDGGNTWVMQLQNQDPNGFFDCFAFWDAERGVTMADSVAGRFPVVRTLDGATWLDIGDRLPPALPGEASFASSGTCAATQGHKHAWLTTGGVDTARVLATTDRGQTWAAYPTPLSAGAAGGGFSIAFRDRRHGVIGGGDLLTPADIRDNFARSRDGGKTWQLGTRAPIAGAIYGLTYATAKRDDDEGEDEHEHGKRVRVVATAPTAAAWSDDEGTTWSVLPNVTGYWAVAFANQRTGWLVGTGGRILRVDF
jgi:photosystem II stability/assembly factor-like uncharacterized protein